MLFVARRRGHQHLGAARVRLHPAGLGAGSAARFHRSVAHALGARRRIPALYSQPLARSPHPGRRHRADRLRLLASLGGRQSGFAGQSWVGAAQSLAAGAVVLGYYLVYWLRAPPVSPPSSSGRESCGSCCAELRTFRWETSTPRPVSTPSASSASSASTRRASPAQFAILSRDGHGIMLRRVDQPDRIRPIESQAVQPGRLLPHPRRAGPPR